MGLEKATKRLRDIWQNHQPSMEQNSNHEEQSNREKNVSGKDFAASPNISEVLKISPPRTMDIFFNDDLDFLEVQRVNNIVRAAYREFMILAARANAWILSPPAVGSVEEFQEMFHTPPPHGSTVECSTESAILPIPPHFLISLMMDAEKWASMFNDIICHGSDEVVLRPLRTFLSTADTEVILVDAQFRLPAEFLPRWSTCFLRFKKLVGHNIYAIFDVSTDYFMDTIFDPTQRIEYKRRPSGVIIRQRDEQSEVVWVENAEVEVIDVPKNVSSNFTLTAKDWVSILSHNVKRRCSELMTSRVLKRTHEIADLLRITDNMKRMYLERINPFPSERKWELFTNDKIRISRDMSASCIGYQNDYIATSTIHIPLSPIKLFEFLARNSVKLQWLSIMYPEQLEMAVACFTEDQSNCITLCMNSETGDGGGANENLEFFLQESSMNEYCSFVLSTRMTEMDVHLSFVPRFCRNSVFLRPSGFSIMPAGPGGLQSEASHVTICVRRELENVEDDQVIEAMSKHMNDVIDQIIQLQTPSVADDEDPVQDSP